MCNPYLSALNCCLCRYNIRIRFNFNFNFSPNPERDPIEFCRQTYHAISGDLWLVNSFASVVAKSRLQGLSAAVDRSQRQKYSAAKKLTVKAA